MASVSDSVEAERLWLQAREGRQGGVGHVRPNRVLPAVAAGQGLLALLTHEKVDQSLRSLLMPTGLQNRAPDTSSR